VRVRLERNLADTNGDSVTDINPAFQMLSGFSAWSSHGRQAIDIDLRGPDGMQLPPTVARFVPPLSVATFIDPKNRVFDYKDLLGAAIDSSFTDSRGAKLPFWNASQARSPSFGLGGLIVQRRPDLHPRVASGEQNEQFDSRTEDIPRMHLPHFLPLTGTAAAAPRDFTPLLQQIDKTHVPSPHHAVTVTWSNVHGEPMLTCTWPVIFAK
jgi:hypothetical protein